MNLVVGSARAERGEKAFGDVTVEFPDGTIGRISVGVINGAGEGPVIYMQGCTHGIEICGAAIVTKILTELDPQHLSGVFIGVPVNNRLALFARRHTVGQGPEEKDPPTLHNMSYTWPGDPNGTNEQRVSHALWNDAVVKADYVMDIHCGAKWGFYSIEVEESDPKSVEIGKAFGLPFIRPRHFLEHSVLGAALQAGKTPVLPDGSCQHEICWKPVNALVQGTYNVMKYLGMLKGKPTTPKRYIFFGRDPCEVVYAPTTGLFVVEKWPNEEVKTGDIIGKLVDIQYPQIIDITSPIDGTLGHIGRVWDLNPEATACDVSLPHMHSLITRGTAVATIYP